MYQFLDITIFQHDEVYPFLDITISLQVSNQEAITLAKIVYRSMSGVLAGIARIHGTHSFIHSFIHPFVHSFIHRSFVRSFEVCYFDHSFIFIQRERERERERASDESLMKEV